MEERSKTNKEIFEKEYPLEKAKDNIILCSEAIGYLKALIRCFPSEQEWGENKLAELMLIAIFYMKQ